ncbi:hypothetical protein [Pelagovum pacificum]|uniref:Uncharacterized protein n=1 Tax=Pelagovum pacificum TaxID=2588711 RepID=A0A5C5GA53_9RHOB|nr:hypothetical protein [Pelagovum pacificum]QQA41571.1 hypothetical protein I8N54_12140 [Pelagovum pacificum]TNY30850.1 hypothetical protein FHY64_17215 [Pelagovum pacificum]
MADPEIQTGTPTLRWADVREEALAWCRRAAASDEALRLVDQREDVRRLLDLRVPGSPRLMTFGHSFPEGEWTEATLAIHVILYDIEPDDAAGYID